MTPRDKERLAWGLLIVLSLFARLIGLGHRAMSHDESLHAFYAYLLARDFSWPPGGLPAFAHDPMMHGPLLFHLNAFVHRLLGVGDFTARLVPALAGAGCVAMLALYRRWLGARGAFAAAVLVSLNPGLLAYSRYIRNDIYISLFTLVMVWALLRHHEEGRARHLLALTLAYALSFVCKEVCFIHGVVLGAACVGFAVYGWTRSREKLPWRDPTAPWVRWGDAAVTLLTLALPFATPLFFAPLGWDAWDRELLPRTPEQLRHTWTLALTLAATSGFLALVWFGLTRRLAWWAAAFALFWFIQILLYTTLFTNVARGLDSGIAGSLGYWLAQHEVERGSSDPFFYVSLHLLYEPLLLVAAGLGTWRLRRGGPVLPLLLCWTLGNLAIYSWAGERMPWLLIHISLPLCLLSGPAIAHHLRKPTTPRAARSLALLLPLCVLYVFNSLRLNGPNADSHTEPLYYAHGGPRLKAALDIANHTLEQHPGSLVQVDPEYAWPLAWYFRDTPASYSDDIDPPRRDASVAFVPPAMRTAYVGTEWTPRGEFVMIHWPRQQWHTFSRENFQNLLTRPEVRRTFLRFYFLREVPDPGPGDFPQPHSFLLITREAP